VARAHLRGDRDARARRRGRPLQHAPDGGGRAPVRARGAARHGPRGRRRDARGAGGRRGPDAGPAARHRAAAAARVARGHRGRDARRVLRRRDDGQGGGHGHRAGDPRRRAPRRRRRPRDGARPPEPRRCVLRAHWPRAPRRGHAGRLMLTGLLAALGKDLRLLARDRVGLVFLTLAPIVVISVAGLSLATLYGAEPGGGTAPVVPLADEDGGWVGRAVRERLTDEPSVRVRPVATAAAAGALVQAKRAAAALVVPAGTSDAVAAGRAAALVLLTDPVKTVDVAYVRGLAQELRHGLETAAVERAQHDLDPARAQAADAREGAADDLGRGLDGLGARLAAMRAGAQH